MIDPDLKAQLDLINQNLVAIEKRKSSGVWRAFFNGMFGALGYVVGILIVVFILGWVLQKAGLLQSFQEQIKSFTNLVQSAQKLIPTQQTPTSSKIQSQIQNSLTPSQSTGGGETTVTLPGGQQVQVQLPQ